MNKSLQKILNRTFLELLADLKNKQETETFFKDILGEKDYDKLITKLALIYWLRKKRPDDVIKNNLRVSTTEISETKKLMTKKGIKLAIKYMEAEEFATVWSEKIKSFTKK